VVAGEKCRHNREVPWSLRLSRWLFNLTMGSAFTFGLSLAVARIGLGLAATAALQRPRQLKTIACYRELRQDMSVLDAFGHTVDYVGGQSQGCYEQFMLDMNYFALGHGSIRGCAPLRVQLQSRFQQIFGWHLVANVLERLLEWQRSNDPQAQLRRFWYAVALSYRYGPQLAELICAYHEWNACGPLTYLPGSGRGYGTPEERELARLGVALGRRLRERSLPLSQVGAWIRIRLG
jgi:hypothetical protein